VTQAGTQEAQAGDKKKHFAEAMGQGAKEAGLSLTVWGFMPQLGEALSSLV